METPAVQDASTPWAKPEAYDYTALQADRSDTNRGQWAGSARIYEFEGDIGEVGPKFEELEIELFGPPEDRKGVTGVDIENITRIKLVQEGPVKIEPISSFQEAGLHPVMQENVALAGYEVPTPIQRYTLPAVNKGYDVIGIAQTGSGKTAAYLIPILNKLMGKAKKLAAPRPNPLTYRPGIDPPVRAEPLVVIVVPTRELAIQIFNDARKFCYRTMLRPCVAYGGGPIAEQVLMLSKGCDVLVATPGRLIDFIQRPHVLTFRRLRYMVIDEADEMLQNDWEADFVQILTGGDQEEGNVKYMLLSATFPKAARNLAKEYLSTSHVRFRVGRAGSSHENIQQKVVQVEPWAKKESLLPLLNSLPPCRTIIFVNNKRTADELDDYIFNMGLPCTSMHADRTQLEREAAMRAFRAGRAPILIATGVSARGIDVRNVMHVVNYDMPSIDHGGIEEYTHRIGRTGRMGYRGMATSFFTDRDEPMASVLTRTLLETKQPVPEFLAMHIPADHDPNNLKFEADSDFDENDVGGAGGESSWDNNEVPAGAADGWSGGPEIAPAGGEIAPTGGEIAPTGGDSWGNTAGNTGAKTDNDQWGAAAAAGW